MTMKTSYDQILALADPQASKEVILARLADFEAQSALRVRDSKRNFSARVNAMIEDAAEFARKEMGRETQVVSEVKNEQ